MLAALRRFAGTWPARIFFVLLVGSFGLWGVADVLRNGLGGADPNAVATVGGERIDPHELQDVSRRMLAQYQQQSGSTAAPTPEIRRGIAEQALQQLVIQAAFAAEVKRLGVQVPDEALRQATFSTPAFQGPAGQFDHNTFLSVLSRAGMTEAHYLQLLRADLAQRQVVESVRAGGYSPAVINRLVFTFQGETRTAEMVTLPFAAAPEPPAPTDEQLQRQYDDNANVYRAPEYRRVKIVVLSPETVARDLTVSDADAQDYYQAHQADFGKPETRSVQVIVAQTEAAAKTLATAWAAGADWTAMQKQAGAAGAAAIELDDQTRAAFPSPDLLDPVFAAVPNAVDGPVNANGGWAVFRVTKAEGGNVAPFAAVEAEVKAKAALEQAADLVYDRANKVQDQLAAGSKLDELPTGLGLAAVAGTLDRQGDTPDGQPAPIPGSPVLREAIIAKAFTMQPGDQPTLENGPASTFYAVSVDSITPPKQKTFDEVKDQVRDDWIRDTKRHEQDVAATALLTAVEDGKTLKEAAAAANQPVTTSPPITRGQPPAGVPPQLVQLLFATAQGHATMVDTGSAFVVAVPVTITKPDPATNAAGMERVQRGLAGAVSDDLEMTFAAGLRAREKVVVNRQMFEQVAQ